MSFYRSVRYVVSSVVVAVLAAGCASIGLGRSAEEIVLERAQARWNALVERDFAAAYPFMTPAYRAVVPQKRYGNQFVGPAQWESAKAKSAKCEDKRCVVTVELNVRILLPGHMNRVTPTHLDETWVLEEGQWFKFEVP